MSSWKSKVFCNNRFNFYSSIVMGLVIMGGSFFFVFRAIAMGMGRSPSCLLLLGIYFVAIGHFAIVLQNYSERLVKSIEEEDARKNTQGDETISV